MGLPPYHLIGSVFKSATPASDVVKQAELNVRQTLRRERGDAYADRVKLTKLEVDSTDTYYVFVSFLLEEPAEGSTDESPNIPRVE